MPALLGVTTHSLPRAITTAAAYIQVTHLPEWHTLRKQYSASRPNTYYMADLASSLQSSDLPAISNQQSNTWHSKAPA